jgi:hypothetical protein
MDQLKLRSLVFEKTGVKIDVDDPIFALVALNEAVLAEAVERHVALLDAATEELAAQVGSWHDGGMGKARAGAERPGPAPAVAKAIPTVSSGVTPEEWRMAGLAAAAAVFGAVLVLAGQAMFFKPPELPAPAPVLQARELTPEQSAALRQGERLAKAVQKLDPKTRAALEAALQKP